MQVALPVAIDRVDDDGITAAGRVQDAGEGRRLGVE
jgi:hypothetical protein